MAHKKFYIYILASKPNSTLYVGLTSNLQKRIFEHKNKLIEGFTSKYNVDHLVYYEVYDDFDNAVSKEKNMKAWKRAWKIELIQKSNPDWNDLYNEICS